MKTQERRMKHCISACFFYLGIFFFSHSEAFAYSSIAPWQNEDEPTKGLIFEPKIGYQATDINSLEAELNLNGAITSDLTAYGRYSVQTAQILGLSDKLFHSRRLEISAQVESTYSQDSVLGFTGGLFAKVPTSIFGLPTFNIEVGLGFATSPAISATSLPFSLLFTHEPERSGFYYGTGLSGESGIASASTWISFRILAGFQNGNGIRYGVDVALPATEINAQNVTAISFNLRIPFDAGNSQDDSPPKPVADIAADPNPHYDLNAKVSAMNESLYLLKIDKGSSDSIAKGQTFDIYSDDNRMARAQVIAVKKDEAVLNVIEYNQEYWIELGFSARRLSRGME